VGHGRKVEPLVHADDAKSRTIDLSLSRRDVPVLSTGWVLSWGRNVEDREDALIINEAGVPGPQSGVAHPLGRPCGSVEGFVQQFVSEVACRNRKGDVRLSETGIKLVMPLEGSRQLQNGQTTSTH
jgi:hypothetical protein